MKADEVLALLSANDVSALDQMADATGSEVDLAAVQSAYYKDERFRVPVSLIR